MSSGPGASRISNYSLCDSPKDFVAPPIVVFVSVSIQQQAGVHFHYNCIFFPSAGHHQSLNGSIHHSKLPSLLISSFSLYLFALRLDYIYHMFRQSFARSFCFTFCRA